MSREERLLRDLCLEIAYGRLSGRRFTDLLLQTGIHLDDDEWETANRILGRVPDLTNGVEESLPTC